MTDALSEAAELIERLTAPVEGLETTTKERADWTERCSHNGFALSGDDVLRLLRDFHRLLSRAIAEKAAKIELAEHLDKVVALAAAEVGRANAENITEWKRSLAANLRGNWEAAACIEQMARHIAREEIAASLKRERDEANESAKIDWAYKEATKPR